MKKHTIIIVLTSLVILAVICVIGNVITIADKVSELSLWLGYSFYAVLLALTAVFVVWPTMKIIFTPELEPSGELMDEEDRKEAERMVRKSAKNVFILTSVLQNGALDVFTCVFKSAANGMINAFVTLRVGMTALKYLEEGSLYFNENRQAIRKEIRRRAVKCMPSVVGGGVKNAILGLKNLF